MAQIPSSGPLVKVANHPFGGVEGIILAEVFIAHDSGDIDFADNHVRKRLAQYAENHQYRTSNKYKENLFRYPEVDFDWAQDTGFRRLQT